MKPLGDRVVVEPIDPPDQVGGLYVPDVAREERTMGKVVAIGEGVPVGVVRPGDVVVYVRYAGVEVEVDGVRYLALRFPDLVMVL